MRDFFTDIFYELFVNVLHYIGSFVRWIFSGRRTSFNDFHTQNEKKWYDVFISVSITIIIGFSIYYTYNQLIKR
ncbi:hypothetical protein [Halobacteriovorax sp. RT-1-4]|uniref:hypothetical protein n=1 Tax=unclassified Halobacteriovorax TaxID=2639665 RepID=UPI00399BA6FE